MKSFSSLRKLQVAYTRRPPPLTRRAAPSRMAACLTCSSAMAPGCWRHLTSGLRRSVPRPEHGASTSTRSILPARRLILASRSCAICTGCTFDRPLRAMRGLSLARRFSDTSNAYRRPVLRMMAPSASVLPPAPAQKSTTISPRLAPTIWDRIWLPSSCTSMAPLLNSGRFCRAGFCRMRRPSGANGVDVLRIGACASSAATSSRVALSELTRKSSGAGLFMASASSSVSSSPHWATSLSNSHLGMLERMDLCISLRSIWVTRSSHCTSSSVRPPSESMPTASAMPSRVRRRMVGPPPASEKSVKNDLLRSTL